MFAFPLHEGDRCLQCRAPYFSALSLADMTSVTSISAALIGVAHRRLVRVRAAPAHSLDEKNGTNVFVRTMSIA